MNASQIAHYRAALERLRSDLGDSIAAGQSGAGTVELDQAKVGRLTRMDALQMQSMAMAEKRQRQIRLQRTEAALQRIAQGTYGICCDCETEIATARLDSDPSAPFCIDCASEKDAAG